MFGDRFSSSTSCSRWLHDTEPGRVDQVFSGRFLGVATHPHLSEIKRGIKADSTAALLRIANAFGWMS